MLLIIKQGDKFAIKSFELIKEEGHANY